MNLHLLSFDKIGYCSGLYQNEKALTCCQSERGEEFRNQLFVYFDSSLPRYRERTMFRMTLRFDYAVLF